MKINRNSVRLPLTAVLAVAVTCFMLPMAAHAQNVSKTKMAGKYTVNLKVLPAEGFSGADAPMVRDGGAMPETIHGPMHPNHHMVVFIKKNGAPVEHARVKIHYRMTKSMNSMMGNDQSSGMSNNHAGMMGGNHNGTMANKNSGMMGDKGMMAEGSHHWTKLPVVRMHVRGKGKKTTHFGNNVYLAPGNYEVRVKVNGKTALFHITI